MKTRGFVLFTVFALAFLLPSFTLIAQQPHAVPPNDNFIDAIPVTIGKSYTMPDLGAATNQGGEPTTSCRSNTVIPNSVWYRVTVAEYSFVRLSTFGSLVAIPNIDSADTVMAVYTLSGISTFSQVTCNDDANGSVAAQVTFPASAGIVYYVAVGSYPDVPLLPSSTLKLTTQMLWKSIRPVNHSFETPISGPGWKVKNGNDDTRVCNDVNYPAADNFCVFRFIGTPGRTTKLVQVLPFPSDFVARKNAHIEVGFFVRAADTGILEKSKITITISYKDGTAPTVKTVNLAGLAAASGYSNRVKRLTLASGKVASIKFEVKFGAEDGVLLVDNLTLFYGADSSTRASGLLPVPPSPAAK